MNHPDRIDPLEQSLRSIGGLDWPGPERSEPIEELLMHQQPQPPGRLRSRLGWWIGAGAILTGGMVYAGVRAYDQLRVHLEVNGVDHYQEVQPGPDGTAMISVPTEGGGHARVLVGPENIGPDGAVHASIRVSPSIETAVPATSQVPGAAPPESPKPK